MSSTTREAARKSATAALLGNFASVVALGSSARNRSRSLLQLAPAEQQLHALPRTVRMQLLLLSLLLPLGLNLLQLDDRGALELLGNDLSYLVMISFSRKPPLLVF